MAVKAPYSLRGRTRKTSGLAFFSHPRRDTCPLTVRGFPGLAPEVAQEVLVAVEEGFGPLVAADEGSVESQMGQQVVGIGVRSLQQRGQR
jgi:hypothetical protein